MNRSPAPRLPARPLPMRRRWAARRPGAAGFGAPARGSGAGYRPLHLVFRRPTRTPPQPLMMAAGGATVAVSLYLALRLHHAERLRLLVREGRTPAAAQQPGP